MTSRRKQLFTVLFAVLFYLISFAQADGPPVRDPLAVSIHAELAFLASDALHGRGSGTPDELIAAAYIASELEQMGVAPAGDHGGYIQNVSGKFQFRGGPRDWNTRNVIGVLEGGDPKLKSEVVLLTAHLDHLGIRKA